MSWMWGPRERRQGQLQGIWQIIEWWQSKQLRWEGCTSLGKGRPGVQFGCVKYEMFIRLYLCKVDHSILALATNPTFQWVKIANTYFLLIQQVRGRSAILSSFRNKGSQCLHHLAYCLSQWKRKDYTPDSLLVLPGFCLSVPHITPSYISLAKH